MSSPKSKKVTYERGTKGSKSSHGHHSSRDSGVGSSSASDRASVGTTANETTFNYQQIKDQKHILHSVQEALNAANERIQKLEANNNKLKDSFAESNKEIRVLKREKAGLLQENQDLLDALDEVNRKLRKETSPRTSTASSTKSANAKIERRQTPPRKGPDSPREYRQYDERPPGSHHSDNRRSAAATAPMYTNLPSAPQPPPNPHPNPFTPLPQRAAPVSVSHASAPNPVVYAPPTLSYTAQPMYAVTPHPNAQGTRYQDDGKYHLQPL